MKSGQGGEKWGVALGTVHPGEEEQIQQGSPTEETRGALDFGRHGKKKQNFKQKQE